MDARVRLFGPIAIAGVLLVPLGAQQALQTPLPPAGTGAITGTVVDGSTGAAVAGALVFLQNVQPGQSVPLTRTRQVTDALGRFAFVEMSGEGGYTITASKFGYLDGGYGRDVSPLDPLRMATLKRDEWVSNLKVQVWRPGAISGAVRDEAGEPVVGVYVRALVRFRIQGRDDVLAGPMTTTNDRGEYRLSGLAPGRYVIQVPSVQASVPAATKLTTTPGNVPEGAMEIDDSHRLVIGRYPLPPPPANGRQMAYPIAFHPASATLALAAVIDLKFGDDRPNIDLALVPVPTARVTGIVEGPPDSLRQLTLRLLPAGLENVGLGAEAATALVGADGRFTFVNVPAGSYTIDAPVKIAELTTSPPSFGGSGFNSRPGGNRFPTPPPVQGSGYSSNSVDLIPGATIVDSSYRSGAAEYSGRAPLIVAAGDVNNVVLRLRPHATFSGRIVIDADPSKPTEKPPSRIPLRLDPATGDAYLGLPQSSFQQDGPPDTFTIVGAKQGLYFLRQNAYSAWIIKSITWKGRDYLTLPFDTSTDDDFSGITVTMTNATPELSGSVRGSNQVPAESSMVVAFPVDRAGWRNTGLYPTRMKVATVSSTGTYRFATLPAGEYLIAAIDRARIRAWRDAEFLTRLEGAATRVTLSWGTKMSQDLTTVGIR